jgi:hypothetical protein
MLRRLGQIYAAPSDTVGAHQGSLVLTELQECCQRAGVSSAGGSPPPRSIAPLKVSFSRVTFA